MRAAGVPLRYYLPLFLLLAFSGNPLMTSGGHAKVLLVVYLVGLVFFCNRRVSWTDITEGTNRVLKLCVPIFLIVSFQFQAFGSVSFPGVFALIVKLLIALFTICYYKRKRLDPFVLFIRLMAFLSIISLPFFFFNFFSHTGVQLSHPALKSLLFYTSSDFPDGLLRNCGMFWEPGAFAGYLNLSLIFIALENRSLSIGRYKKEVFWIIIGLLSTMSTTGYLVFGIIACTYFFVNYEKGRVILLPLLLIFGAFMYNNLSFLSDKIHEQYRNALIMEPTDVSNTRFGSIMMDLVYIKDKPLIGNGLDEKTRFRFHPSIKEDIGHGNGMSNFIVWWGIPFFLFWVYNVGAYSLNKSQSKKLSLFATFLIVLLLQGEQFLNFPFFLLFFLGPMILKSRYENIMLYNKSVV